MQELTVVRGDATLPQGAGNKVIAHVCNDVGGWGAGFVLAVSRRWPEPEEEYRRWHRGRATNDFALGAVQLVAVEPGVWVTNMVAQHDVRPSREGPPIRYDALEGCLAKLADEAVRRNASVHMPRIGCGLAGGSWEMVGPIISRTLCARNIAVVVYDFG